MPRYDVGKKKFPATSPGICQGTIKFLGRHAPQKLWTERDRNISQLRSGRQSIQGGRICIYVPSWCLNEINSLQLVPKTHTTQSKYCQKRITDAFFAYHSISTIPTEKNCDHLDIAAKQLTDDLLTKSIKAFQTKDSSQGCYIGSSFSINVSTISIWNPIPLF